MPNQPSANQVQVGGSHYKSRQVQHWDYAAQLPYLDGQVSKYVDRHQQKGGLQDLLKAEHYLHKAMEYYYPEEYAAHLDKMLRDGASSTIPVMGKDFIARNLNEKNKQFWGSPEGEETVEEEVIEQYATESFRKIEEANNTLSSSLDDLTRSLASLRDNNQLNGEGRESPLVLELVSADRPDDYAPEDSGPRPRARKGRPRDNVRKEKPKKKAGAGKKAPR